jgi:MFS family permease
MMIVSDYECQLVQAALYMVGRFITGMMGGAFSLTAPAYTSEISEKEIRGTLGSYFQLMVTIGILFVYGVGSATSVLVLSVICGIVPLVFGAIFWFMPETPLYYLQKGQRDRAQASLQWFRGRYCQSFSLYQLLDEAVKNETGNVGVM